MSGGRRGGDDELRGRGEDLVQKTRPRDETLSLSVY